MNILVPDISIAEKVLRAGVVYAFLLVAFRLCGKRQLGQLSAFDLVVLRAASSATTCGGSGSVPAICARPCAITGASRGGTSATPSPRKTAT
jgi:hypothetical protein